MGVSRGNWTEIRWDCLRIARYPRSTEKQYMREIHSSAIISTCKLMLIRTHIDDGIGNRQANDGDLAMVWGCFVDVSIAIL